MINSTYSKDMIKKLENILELKSYSKGNILTSKDNFYILKSGVVKATHVDDNKKPYTTPYE